jgi:hypothetical protein
MVSGAAQIMLNLFQEGGERHDNQTPDDMGTRSMYADDNIRELKSG